MFTQLPIHPGLWNRIKETLRQNGIGDVNDVNDVNVISFDDKYVLSSIQDKPHWSNLFGLLPSKDQRRFTQFCAQYRYHERYHVTYSPDFHLGTLRFFRGTYVGGGNDALPSWIQAKVLKTFPWEITVGDGFFRFPSIPLQISVWIGEPNLSSCEARVLGTISEVMTREIASEELEKWEKDTTMAPPPWLHSGHPYNEVIKEQTISLEEKNAYIEECRKALAVCAYCHQGVCSCLEQHLDEHFPV
jgi:hypothetical protein